MTVLPLPENLNGPWDHALILTYGMNLPFFEHSIWDQLGNHCNNVVILADGGCYLEACNDYARDGLARYINQRYIAEGIFAPHAAHAKLVLLTNTERGRLFVGSGNLNLDGYAS